MESDHLLNYYEEDLERKSQSINLLPYQVYLNNKQRGNGSLKLFQILDSVDLSKVRLRNIHNKFNSIDKLTNFNNAFFPKQQHFLKENFRLKQLQRKRNLQAISPILTKGNCQEKMPLNQSDVFISGKNSKKQINLQIFEMKPSILYPVCLEETMENSSLAGVLQRKIQGIKQRELSKQIIQNQNRLRSTSKKNIEGIQQKIQAALDIIGEASSEEPKYTYGLRIQRLEINDSLCCFFIINNLSKVGQLRKGKRSIPTIQFYEKLKSKTKLQEIINETNLNRKGSFSKTPQQFFDDKIEKRNMSKSVHTTINIQKKESIFSSRLNKYYNFINKCALQNCFQIQQKEESIFFYQVGRGNNSRLVKNLLKQRWWWQVLKTDDEQTPHFIWTQIKIPSIHEKQVCSQIRKQQLQSLTYYQTDSIQVHNHLELNFHLGNKKAFFHNIKKYYELIGQDPFQNLPLTYHICKGENDPEFLNFLRFFNQIEEQNKNSQKKIVKNIWIIKPGENSNRGNGICIYDNLDDIKNKINQIQVANKKFTYILQQYIQKPFLYLKRKFDIRCYILVTSINSIIKAYWYQDGYIRTSSVEYNLKGGFDPFIHLTNDAVQKKNQETYGKYENGNKVSFQEFQRYLEVQNPDIKVSFLKSVVPQMKQLATDCVKSVYTKIDTNKRLHNFEVFGLDFMLDINLKPYIIEVNTNPCLELSCPLLERIIPSMLENAFWIGLDPLFPPPQKWPSGKRHTLNCNPQENNRFELIFDEMKEGNQLNKLYENTKEIKYCFDDFEESEIESGTEQ